MNDKEKIEKILSLLIDEAVNKADKTGAFVNNDERFGALVMQGITFRKAYAIARKETTL